MKPRPPTKVNNTIRATAKSGAGANARWRAAGMRTHASRWSRWASALTRRFAVPARPRRGALPLELLRQRAAVVMARIDWSPAIAVHLALPASTPLHASAEARERGMAAMTMATPWHAADAPAARVLATLVASRDRTRTAGDRVSPVERILRQTRRATEPQLTHDVLTRVIARTERIDVRANARAGDLVLATPTAIVAKQRAAAAPELSSPMALRAPAATVWPSRDAAPQPPINVDRLADHVLHQLDRRVTAWRERQGRS